MHRVRTAGCGAWSAAPNTNLTVPLSTFRCFDRLNTAAVDVQGPGKECAMPEPLISNVSDTARWMAAYRAAESARHDALFTDPFAERFAGARGHGFPGWIHSIVKHAQRWKRLPTVLRPVAYLPEPNPRKLSHAPWSGVVRFDR
jgi:hypothetical protein